MSASRTDRGPLHQAARLAAWLAPVVFFAAAGALLTWVVRDARDNGRRYYSDDDAIRRETGAPPPRQTLWSYPDAWTGPVVTNAIEGGPTFTADDGHAVLAIRAPERGDTDLYMTDWDGRSWSAAALMEGVNSASNEFEGALSSDDRSLFFTSDREGGRGAADIWVARCVASNRWVVVAPLDGEVNTGADERGIALSADGRTLYFASNRGGGGGGYDLFRARLVWPEAATEDATNIASVASAPPAVDGVERLAEASSDGDDRDPALSPAGDLLYFSSNRRGGHGGYDLYVSRILRDVVGKPENAGEEFNGEGDERRPASRMQGYDMAYATTAGSNALHVVSVTRREVMEKVDYARWESYLALLGRIKWWFLALVVSLVALIYLIRQYRDLTNRFHKCLMASAIAHAALLFIVATRTVTKEVTESTDAALEMLVDKVATDDMRQELNTRKESMQMDQPQKVAELPVAAAPRATVVQDREAVAFEEMSPAASGPAAAGGMVVAAAPSRKEQSAVDAVAVAADQPSAPQAVAAASRTLKTLQAELQVAAVEEIAMEEMPAGAAPADSAKEVTLDTAVAQKTIAAGFAQARPVETKAVVAVAGGDQVAGAEAASVSSPGGMAAASLASATTREATAGEAKAFRTATGYDVPLDGLEVAMEVPAYGETVAGASNATRRAETWGSGVSGAFDPAGGVAGVTSSFRGGGGPAGAGKGLGSGGAAGGGQSAGGGSAGAGGVGPRGAGAGVADVVGGGDGTGAGGGGESASAVPGGRGGSGGGSGSARGVPGGRPSGGALEGTSAGDVLASLGKGSGVRAGDLRLGAAVEMEVPAEYANRGVPDLIVFSGRPSLEVVEALGGSGETEGSIRGSLDWLTRNQEPDGRWSCEKHGGLPGHDVAATSLALLCYYGWGMKHNVDCEFLKPVKAGMAWLTAQVRTNGDIRAAGVAKAMYDQGIAGIVLCEAYGISRDPELLAPASNVVAFIANAQNKDGSWRYEVNSQDSDLSVFGWQFMALHSARMSGIPVPSNAFVRADAWLNLVSGGTSGGLYGYQAPNQPDRPTMTACGMFCRQLQKVAPTEDRMKESAAFLRTRPLPGNNVDFYYAYYATLAMYQHQGEAWEEWNKRMKEVLPPLQRKTGAEAGSWDAQGGRNPAMGRCVTTAIAALSLEVYYRFLPMYGYRTAEKENRK